MKRIVSVFFTLMIVAGANLFAQVAEGTSTVLNYAGLENKLKKSEADIQDAKKNMKAKTWTSRASLLVNIFNVHNDVLQRGMDQISAKLFLKEPQKIETLGQGADKIENFIYERVTLKFVNGALEGWTETSKIHPDPLTEAHKALDEAIRLNADGKANDDILAVIRSLKSAHEIEGVSQYEIKEFGKSYENFAQILELNKNPLMNNQVDTIIVYYTGRAALENQNYAAAAKLFEETAKLGYKDPFLYIFLKQSYFGAGDTASGVRAITEGFSKYPDNQSIMIELINYYLVSNNPEEALKLLAKAKASDPTNVSYVFAEGTLYDKLNRYDEAEGAYKQCLEISPEFFDATFNLGVLYFNRAVKIYEDAAKISDNAEYDKVKLEGDKMLERSIPFMEKAHKIDSSSRDPLETLKTVYYRLNLNDKYQEVVNKLNSM